MSVYDYDGNALNSIYGYDGLSLNYGYSYDGDEIFSGGGQPIYYPYTYNGDPVNFNINGSATQSKKFRKRLMFSIPDLPSGTQGFAVEKLSNSIFQFYSSKIYVIDIATGEYHSLNIGLGHGADGIFKSTKESPSDDYPLLYVSYGEGTTDSNGDAVSYLFEIKCTETTATHQKKYKFYLESDEYSSLFNISVDLEHNIAYTLSRPTDDQSKRVRVYDLSNCSVVDDTAFSTSVAYVPTLIDSFEVQWMATTQSMFYYNGYLFILSYGRLAHGNYVYVVDINQEAVIASIGENPGGETEGIGLVLNANGAKYDLIISTRENFSYYRYEFE